MTWLKHVKKTFAEMKKKNASIKFKEVLKAAAKTWKKKTVKGGKNMEDEDDEEEEEEVTPAKEGGEEFEEEKRVEITFRLLLFRLMFPK